MIVSKPCRVLIVGDEPSLDKILRTLLSAGGFTVEEARSGEEVLAARDLMPRSGILAIAVREAHDDSNKGRERSPELISRLRNVLGCTCVGETQELRAGALAVDLPRRILRRDGVQVHLSPKEFELLAFLMQNQGVLLTHEQLLSSVWGPAYGTELEYLRTYVRMLRKKIETDPAKPDYILTAPWVGYRFCNPNEGTSEARGGKMLAMRGAPAAAARSHS
jgi:two-component system, OmpR family, KDP operon response regulator KdpE